MRILLPIDGTDCSDSTLEWVIKTYTPDQVEFYLLFVVSLLPDLDTAKLDIDYAISVLNRRTELLEAQGYPIKGADYVIGEDPADEICKYAHQIQPDAIIIGSHGRHGLSKFLMGSVSNKVLEQCDCPVTIHHEAKKQK